MKKHEKSVTYKIKKKYLSWMSWSGKGLRCLASTAMGRARLAFSLVFMPFCFLGWFDLEVEKLEERIMGGARACSDNRGGD